MTAARGTGRGASDAEVRTTPHRGCLGVTARTARAYAVGMTELHLHTVLAGSGPAAAIVLTDEQVAAFGAGKAFPVAVTIGGRTARLRLSRMGGKNMIGFSKATRAELGVEIDQEVDAVIAVDTAERTVEEPPELTAALDAEPALRAAFEKLPYTHRKEHARSVAEAKQEATRDRRIAKVVEAMRG